MYPYVALDSPRYHENSHANHTWDSLSHQTTVPLTSIFPHQVFGETSSV